MNTKMTRSELLRFHKDITTKARSLMEKKNQDYSAADGGVFANFNACTFLGVNPCTGILLRMIDKISRLSSFIERGELKVDEGCEDSVIDIINYSVLLLGMLEEQKKADNLFTMASGISEKSLGYCATCKYREGYTDEHYACSKTKEKLTKSLIYHHGCDLYKSNK